MSVRDNKIELKSLVTVFQSEGLNPFKNKYRFDESAKELLIKSDAKIDEEISPRVIKNFLIARSIRDDFNNACEMVINDDDSSIKLLKFFENTNKAKEVSATPQPSDKSPTLNTSQQSATSQKTATPQPATPQPGGKLKKIRKLSNPKANRLYNLLISLAF